MDNTQQQYTEAFFNYLQFEKRYSVHTLTAYKNDVTQFQEYLQVEYETTKWNEVTNVIMRSWIAHLKVEKKESNKTIHRKVSSIKSFFKFLLRKKWVEKSPADGLTLPKLNKRLPEFLKESETEKLLLYTNKKKSDKELTDRQIWRNRTQELATEVFYATGIRLSELVSLKESHIDFRYRQMKVFGKGGKERLIPLSDKLLSELKLYLQEKPVKLPGTPEVFTNEKGDKLYPKFFYNAVKEQMISSNVKLKKKSPHILRHTFATHLMNEGADINAVKELLGHSSLAATQVYTHNTIEKLKEIYQKAHPKAK